MAERERSFRLQNAANRGVERTKSAGKCGQIYGGPSRIPGPAAPLNATNNQLILKYYFRSGGSPMVCCRGKSRQSLHVPGEISRDLKLFWLHWRNYATVLARSFEPNTLRRH